MPKYKGANVILFQRRPYNIFLTLMLAGVVLILVSCSSDNDNGSEGNNTDNEEVTDISIGLDPYDYSTVPAYLSQVILEQEGYVVEIEEADVGILYEALSNQGIDAYIDVWRPNLHESYLKEYDDDFETAGTIFSDMPMGIAVPNYMEDIDSIEDVKENADLFDHKIYSIEPGSGTALTSEKMLDDYGMEDFDIETTSTAAMLSQVKKNTDNEEPIAFNAWRPHPMFINFDIKFLDDPRDTWKSDDIEIGVTPTFEEESPTAYTLFSNMHFDIDMWEDWLISMDEGKEPRELAETWLEENQDTVDEWLEK